MPDTPRKTITVDAQWLRDVISMLDDESDEDFVAAMVWLIEVDGNDAEVIVKIK